jgi:hypothetical protein
LTGEWVTAWNMNPNMVKNEAISMYDRETRYKYLNIRGFTGRQTVKNNLWLLVIKPTKFTNFSNLFLE